MLPKKKKKKHHRSLIAGTKFLSRRESFAKERGEEAPDRRKAELCHGFARDTFFMGLRGKGRRNFPSSPW